MEPLLFCTWTTDVFEGSKAAFLTAAALVLVGLAASGWIARGAPLRWPARLDLATLGLLLFVGSAALLLGFVVILWRGIRATVLIPDEFGSYVNGTWKQAASIPDARSFMNPTGWAPYGFASAVLPDGRVIYEGGEENAGLLFCNIYCA